MKHRQQMKHRQPRHARKHSGIPHNSLILLLMTAMMCIPSLSVAQSLISKKDLSDLSHAISHAKDYRMNRRHQIDSLKRKMSALPMTDMDRRYNYALKIAENFRQYNVDSSLYYSEMAYRIVEKHGSLEQKILSLLMHNNAMASAGIFTVAEANLNTIGNWDIPRHLKKDFWYAKRILYGNMRDFYEQQSTMYDDATALCREYDDSLMTVLPPTDFYYRFLEGEHLVTSGRRKEGLEHLSNLLKDIPETHYLYGRTAYEIAKVYELEGEHQMQALFLAKSATSDIKACIREGNALPDLANLLYEDNQLEEAYQFINFAIDDALAGNARLRINTIARFLPQIDSAYKKNIQDNHNNLVLACVLAVVLLFVSVFLVFILFRKVKQTRASELKLAKNAKLQDSYIGNFVALSSGYANRLESFTKLVARKLASGQSDELLKLINSGKLTEQQDEDFDKLFDNAFLTLYPDFVENINTLLRPEEQVAVKQKSCLTPELRIYALVRLGIEESTRIAQITNYSVSTVYSYRNRMRNRAINRDTFEAEVRKI